MHLELGQFSNEDLADLATVYNHLAGREDVGQRWQAWGREIAEGIGLELAHRLIARAEHEDPMGWCWYGRLPSPEEPGLWEQST